MSASDMRGPTTRQRLPGPAARDRYRGCLLGGAVGDALGAPVEFMRIGEIVRRFGPAGIRDYVPAYGRRGAITDDTQMTLFTAEGMMRGHVRASIRGLGLSAIATTANAYRRWLATQDRGAPVEHVDSRAGWLVGHRELFAQRAPGLTCLAALRAGEIGGRPPDNHSKGCGGVMRVAPVGMYFAHWLRDADDARHDEVLAETFDTAASIAGNLLGALLGVDAIPRRWLDPLELRETIAEVADDLATVPDWHVGEDDEPESRRWMKKYPGN